MHFVFSLLELKRFLVKSSESAMLTLQNALEVRNEILGPSAATPGMPNFSTANFSGPSRMAEMHLLSTDSDSKFSNKNKELLVQDLIICCNLSHQVINMMIMMTIPLRTILKLSIQKERRKTWKISNLF